MGFILLIIAGLFEVAFASCLGKAKETTGDMFLLWRLKQIIQSQDFEVQGNVKAMKDFEIKKKVLTEQPITE